VAEAANSVINVHWAVMQLVLDLIDYVLVHELAQLNHRNHDAGFWAEVLRCTPDRAARRTRLGHADPGLWLPEPGRPPMRAP
jgi:predicted metal-dependent hydrolase